MMRKVTRETCEAFLAHETKSVGNTVTNGHVLLLHGNTIAQHNADGSIVVTLAGWPSVTTRERLNGLCHLLGLGGGFSQRKFEQFYGSQPITANEWIIVKPADFPAQPVEPELATV
jgi:hypothetical protein